MTDSSGYILENKCVKHREFNIKHEHCLSREPVNGEGRCPRKSLSSLPGKEVREPTTYIFLVIGQTLGLLSHVTE